MKALAVLAALLPLALARPRPQDNPSSDSDTAADSSNSPESRLLSTISSAVALANLEPYVAPLATDPITEWNAFGDSFTAGIGNNGLSDYIGTSFDCDRFLQSYPVKMNNDDRLPGDPQARKLNFGACSGDKMVGVRDKQLTSSPSSGYVALGKPQLAVITISGNDLGFGEAINSCIIRAWGWPNIKDCETVLREIERKIEDEEFLGELDTTILKVVVEAHKKRGANPPHSFQLFLNGYVPFWNEVDKGCDTISWVWYGFSGHFLTRDLRKRMNKIVQRVNFQLERAAHRLRGEGVIYVEGYQDAYVGHQFCDPVADRNLKSPISPNTWFWHADSPWNAGEGPSTTQGNTFDLHQAVLRALVPNEGNRTRILSGEIDPSSISDAFTSKEKFEAALDAAAAADDVDHSTSLIPIQWRRIFHPKGTAHTEHARVNIDWILASRSPNPTSTTSDHGGCQEGDLIEQADVEEAIASLKAKGDDAEKNNCCGGGIAKCGPLLAQTGSASIALCGATEQCVGCAEIAGLIEEATRECMVDGTMGGANGTVAGKEGLEWAVDFVSTD